MAYVSPPSATVFKTQFTEFAAAPDAVVDAHLADAALQLNADLFPGRLGTHACMLAAAQSLALAPGGRDMQLASKDGSTVYDARLKAIKRRATVGLRG